MSKLVLKKTIPEHIYTEEFNWIKLEFMPMSLKYRKIRQKMDYKGTCCFWCKRTINDGEMMALASVLGKGNRILCQECANEALGLTGRI